MIGAVALGPSDGAIANHVALKLSKPGQRIYLKLFILKFSILGRLFLMPSAVI
jgi:hypothetical protein